MSFVKFPRRFATFALVGVLAACTLPQVTQRAEPAAAGAAAARVLAMAPGTGELGRSVAEALRRRGYTVVDALATSGLIGTKEPVNASPLAAALLLRLKAQGIDAVVLLDSAAGYDLVPLLVTARLQASDTGALWSDLSWRNAEGAGRVGTFIDRAVRLDLAKAADQIAAALLQPIQPPPPPPPPPPRY